jgi:hypothetical protein
MLHVFIVNKCSSRFDIECEPTIIVYVKSVYKYFDPPDDD